MILFVYCKRLLIKKPINLRQREGIRATTTERTILLIVFLHFCCVLITANTIVRHRSQMKVNWRPIRVPSHDEIDQFGVSLIRNDERAQAAFNRIHARQKDNKMHIRTRTRNHGANVVLWADFTDSQIG